MRGRVWIASALRSISAERAAWISRSLVTSGPTMVAAPAITALARASMANTIAVRPP